MGSAAKVLVPKLGMGTVGEGSGTEPGWRYIAWGNPKAPSPKALNLCSPKALQPPAPKQRDHAPPGRGLPACLRFQKRLKHRAEGCEMLSRVSDIPTLPQLSTWDWERHLVSVPIPHLPFALALR